MDQTTKWLVRITCLAILGGGIGFGISIPVKQRHESISKTCRLMYGSSGYKFKDCVRNPSKDIKQLNRDLDH